MNQVKRVRYWCFKVLPLVYDDSLSYYEVLCKLTKRLNEVIDNVNELEPLINEMQATLKEIQEQKAEVERQIQLLLDQMRKDVDNMIAEAQDEIDERLSAMEAYAKKEFAKYQALIILLEQQVQDWEVYLKGYYDKGLIEQWTKLKAYVDQRFLDYSEIWNPVWQEVQPSRKTTQEMYDFVGWAIPAGYLDAINITAKELEDLRIPAKGWDTKSGVFLWHWWNKKNHVWEMANPWTGNMDDPRHVLTTLIGMHQEGVTAQELEDANIPVEAYDDSETTAYDHDWTRGWFEQLKAMYA